MFLVVARVAAAVDKCDADDEDEEANAASFELALFIPFASAATRRGG